MKIKQAKTSVMLTIVHKDVTQRLIRKQRLSPKQTLSVRLWFGVYKNCMFSKNKIIQCN